MLRFSVIIPVFNVVKDIKQCLETIASQTFKDFEVLCVDDCGTDGSIDIVKEFTQKDSRFKVLSHDSNRGVSVARNTALKEAQGEYILFIDPDDWVELNMFEAIDNAIKNSNNSDAIVFGYNNCYPDGTVEDHDYNESYSLKLEANNINYVVGCIWNKAFKNSKIKELGVDFPAGLIVEDAEFCFKFFSQIDKCYITKGIYYNYRKGREGSYTTEDIAGERINDTFKILERMYDFSIQKGLFKKYKLALLDYFCQTIKGILQCPNQKDNILKTADTLLDKMNFPNSFKDLEAPKFMFWKN